MTDLRMVPAALAVWVVAWLLTGPGTGWSSTVTWAVAALVALACLQLVLTATGRPTRRAGGSIAAHAALAAACVLAVTVSAHVQLAGRAPLADLARQRVTATLTGTVVSQPEPFSFAPGASAPGAGQHRWVLAARAVDARGVGSTARAHVQVLSNTAPRYGATVRVSGALRPADPGAAETARLTADGASEIRAPPSGLRVLDSHRTALLEVTDPLSAQGRGLVPGAAIGDTTRLPDDLAEEMRSTGLTHITAVSGGHFAVVVAVLTLLCSLARLPRAARVVLVALASLAFVALVRPEPAVLRAAVMAAFALTGVAVGRPSQSVPALAGSIVGLLVVDPWLARSYGFALSAAATGGLVLLAAPLAARLAPWTGDAAAFALAVPLAAQAACGPVLMLLDPAVSTVSVLANLLAAPALVPATVLGLVATVLAPGLPVVAGLVAWVASGVTWWIAAVAHWCAALPGAVLPWLGGPLGALLLAVLTGVVLWAVLRSAPRTGWPESWRTATRSSLREALAPRQRRLTRARFVAVLAAGAVAALVVVVAVPRLAVRSGVPQDWLVAACDVGQGDALALRTGPTSAVVVDVGPDGPAARWWRRSCPRCRNLRRTRRRPVRRWPPPVCRCTSHGPATRGRQAPSRGGCCWRAPVRARTTRASSSPPGPAGWTCWRWATWRTRARRSWCRWPAGPMSSRSRTTARRCSRGPWRNGSVRRWRSCRPAGATTTAIRPTRRSICTRASVPPSSGRTSAAPWRSWCVAGRCPWRAAENGLSGGFRALSRTSCTRSCSLLGGGAPHFAKRCGSCGRI
jgi:competence protein ComEC